MHPADLHQRHKGGVGNLPHEMHPPQIKLRPHLAQQRLFPGAAPRRRAAVAGTFGPHDHRPRLRTRPQHGGQSAHEDVKPPVGFQIAVHKGQHLIPRPQHKARSLQRHGCRRVRPDPRRIDPVMHHVDHVLHRRRKA